MKLLIAALLIAISTSTFSTEQSIHISYSEQKPAFKVLAEKAKKKITRIYSQPDSIFVTPQNTPIPLQKSNLMINIGINPTEAATKQNDSIYAFINQQDLKENLSANQHQWNAIPIDPPIMTMVDIADQLSTQVHKNSIIIAVSEDNVDAINSIRQIAPLKNSTINLVVIKKGQTPAKEIEQHLRGASVIVAIRDPIVWSKKNARWMLRQAYDYRIPVIGYSKAFLKAGAMVSVYASADDIIDKTLDMANYWLTNGTLKDSKVITAKSTIEINYHIANALNYDSALLKKIKRVQ